jgi:hypothetical protein
MAELPKITQNSDFKIQVALTDVNGDAIEVSGLADIEMCIYQQRENVLQSWKQSDNQVETVSDSGGIVSVNVDRANITGNNLQRLFVEVAIMVTDLEFDGGVMRNVISDIPLCNLINSALYNHQ